MSQRLKESKAARRGAEDFTADEAEKSWPEVDRDSTKVEGTVRAGRADGGRADQSTIEYIVAMTREMKRMAQNAGLTRVALILEMAKLEATDQGKGRPS
jgi:hypothetical protein